MSPPLSSINARAAALSTKSRGPFNAPAIAQSG